MSLIIFIQNLVKKYGNVLRNNYLPHNEHYKSLKLQQSATKELSSLVHSLALKAAKTTTLPNHNFPLFYKFNTAYNTLLNLHFTPLIIIYEFFI